MNNTVLKCQECGSILVVNTKDLWHYIKCTHCGSYNIVNLDDVFNQAEIISEDIGDKESE